MSFFSTKLKKMRKTNQNGFFLINKIQLCLSIYIRVANKKITSQQNNIIHVYCFARQKSRLWAYFKLIVLFRTKTAKFCLNLTQGQAIQFQKGSPLQIFKMDGKFILFQSIPRVSIPVYSYNNFPRVLGMYDVTGHDQQVQVCSDL